MFGVLTISFFIDSSLLLCSLACRAVTPAFVDRSTGKCARLMIALKPVRLTLGPALPAMVVRVLKAAPERVAPQDAACPFPSAPLPRKAPAPLKALVVASASVTDAALRRPNASLEPTPTRAELTSKGARAEALASMARRPIRRHPLPPSRVTVLVLGTVVPPERPLMAPITTTLEALALRLKEGTRDSPSVAPDGAA